MVELLDGPQKASITLLKQIEKIETDKAMAARDGDDQAQVRGRELANGCVGVAYRLLDGMKRRRAFAPYFVQTPFDPGDDATVEARSNVVVVRIGFPCEIARTRVVGQKVFRGVRELRAGDCVAENRVANRELRRFDATREPNLVHGSQQSYARELVQVAIEDSLGREWRSGRRKGSRLLHALRG